MVNMLKILVAAVVLLAIVGYGMLGKKVLRTYVFRTAKTNGTESFWLELISIGLVVFFAFTHYLKNDPETNGVMWFGTAVFFFGGVLQLVARKHLYDDATFEDRLSSGFAAAQTGIYAHLRHPSQAALVIMTLGLCLMTDSIWALGVFVVLFIPSVLFRISAEEQKLLDQFGDRYDAYREDSKRIIPGIY